MSISVHLRCDNCGSDTTFLVDYEGETHELVYCPHCGEEHGDELEIILEEDDVE